MMQAGQIFSGLTEENKRRYLVGKLLRTEYRIPTLYSFFEDTKYLEPCTKIMTTLLPNKRKESILQEYRRIYSGVAKLMACNSSKPERMSFMTYQ